MVKKSIPKVYGYILRVYKVDRRTKEGRRLVNSCIYAGASGNFMMEELYGLRRNVYPVSAGWVLDFDPM